MAEGLRPSQEEYANKMAESLCDYLVGELKDLYNDVQFIDPGKRSYKNPPKLYLHRSQPWALEGAVMFTLFAVDYGDDTYEPRLIAVERALRNRREVFRFDRTNAPDSMLKDMLVIEITLRERRSKERLAEIDGGSAQHPGQVSGI